MELFSSAFNHNQPIPGKYTCKGKDLSPPLNWENIPKQTKSLALILDDPDAPKKRWVHWVVYNISPKISRIEEGSSPPDSKELINDFGKKRYGGPCPPSGTHRYRFTLFALDTLLNLGEDGSIVELEKAMKSHILEQITLIGLFSKTFAD